MNNIYKLYKDTVFLKLTEKFQYKNPHQVPKLKKIQINAGLGLNGSNKTYLEKAINEIRSISGQHPNLSYAKKSIAGFKVRKNIPIGLTVTLRREKMYSFFERLVKLVLPRIRDFRGLSLNAFDKYGNYSFGITDQLVFPEINFETVDQRRGFDITLVTSANTKDESFVLLSELGFPFTKK